MEPTPPSPDEALLDFIQQYHHDRTVGNSHELQDYLRRYPGSEEVISREYALLEQSREEGPSREGSREFGPFRLIDTIGQGGQGTVWLAEDKRVGRKVALKIVAPLVSDTRLRRFQREARLLAQLDHPAICPVYEAGEWNGTPYIAMRRIRGLSLAARIRETREVIGKSKRPQSGPVCYPRGAVQHARMLRYFEQAARALHAAHEAGIVHRDIKPGNLMITEDEGRPVLLDFGLAGEENASESSLSMPGQFLGTPAYLAPERISSEGAVADRRADIYSLAATIYEAATLDLPFKAERPQELLRAIETVRPRDPRERNPALPRDLSDVLAVALEKDPKRRYATALELAEDLRRVREFEPILAQPPGPLVRSLRWVRRNRRVAAIGAVISLAYLALGVALLQSDASARRAHAEMSGLAVQYTAGQALIQAEREPVLSLLLAIEAARRAPGIETNHSLTWALEHCVVDSALVYSHRRNRASLTEDWNKILYFKSGREGRFAVFDLTDAERRELVSEFVHGLSEAKMCPTGDWFAYGSSGGKLVIRPTDDALAKLEIEHPGTVFGLEFVPRENLLITASDDHVLRAWDNHSGALEFELRGHLGAVCDLQLSPSGRYLVSWGQEDRLAYLEAVDPPDESVLVWDLVHRRKVWSTEVADTVTAVAFSADEQCLAIGTPSGSVQVWNLEQRQEVSPRFEVPASVRALDFSPDSSRLAVAYGFHKRAPNTKHPGASIWDWKHAAHLLDVDGNENRTVGDVAFSPSGKYVAVLNWSGSLLIYDVITGELRKRVPLTTSFGIHVQWSESGSEIHTVSQEGASRCRFNEDVGLLPMYHGHSEGVVDVRMSPDGQWLASASKDGSACVWAIDEREARWVWHHRGAVTAVDFLSDRRLITTSDSGQIRLWDLDTGQAVLEREVNDEIRQLSGSHGSRQRLIVHGARGLSLWNPDSGEMLALQMPPQEEAGIQLAEYAETPNGDWVVVGTEHGDGWLWRLPDPIAVPLESDMGLARSRITREYPKSRRVLGIAISPSGRRLVMNNDADMAIAWFLGSDKFSVRHWKNAKGSKGPLAFDVDSEFVLGANAWYSYPQVFRFLDFEFKLPKTSFSEQWHRTGVAKSVDRHPTRSLMLIGVQLGLIRVLDFETKEDVLILNTKSPLNVARFSPDGKWVMAGLENGTVRLWPVDMLQFAEDRRPRALLDAERIRFKIDELD